MRNQPQDKLPQTGAALSALSGESSAIIDQQIPCEVEKEETHDINTGTDANCNITDNSEDELLPPSKQKGVSPFSQMELDDRTNFLREMIRDEIKKELENQFAYSAEQIESEFSKLRETLTDNAEKDRQIESKDELFQKVYADLKKHQAGYDRVILAPLLKQTIKWYERATEMYRHYETIAPAFGFGKAVYSDLLREFGNFGDYILDTLDNFDVKPITPEIGSKFDPLVSEAVEAIKTIDPAQNGIVKIVFTPGFRYSDGKIIQYAKVAVYKYEEGVR